MVGGSKTISLAIKRSLVAGLLRAPGAAVTAGGDLQLGLGRRPGRSFAHDCQGNFPHRPAASVSD
jgi:hypothetical protein